MSYITEADLIKYFSEDEVIQLTDRDNDGAIDAEVLSDGIARAESRFDSYLSGRYALPVADPDLNMKNIIMDIWRYLASDNHTTEQIEERYKDAIKWLTRVSDGKIKLNTPAASAENSTAFFLPVSVPIERG